MQVDPQFHQSRAAAKRRRTQRQIRLAVIAGGGFCGVAAVVALATWLISGPDEDPKQLITQIPEDGVEALAQVEDVAPGQGVRLATPFVDIAGDPMILRFETSDAVAKRRVAGPQTLDPTRFGQPGPDRFALMVEDLVVRESRLMTALPSSREDFAFFQAQRSRSLNNQPNLAELIPTIPEESAEETIIVSEGDNSWGEAIGKSDDAMPTTYVSTRVQNTTSIAFVRPEAERERVSRDLVVRLDYPRTLVDLLTSNGFEEEVAAKVQRDAVATFPALAEIATEDGLAAGSIVAVRHRQIDYKSTPVLVAIFGPDNYVGTLSRKGLIGYEEASNPWVQDDLPALASPATDSFDDTKQDYRLLDAVYSAVVRNEVPTTVVGELIVMLSQAYDLEAVAAPGDKVTLLYAPGLGDGPAQIAYAAINGPSGDMPCYVARKSGVAAADEYACYTPRGLRGGGGAFVTPVKGGTLSSPFGPRFHPILKEVRLHGGVDWAAPTGTPIVAARDGTFAVVGNGGGYGNVIYIDHGAGLQSRYAHLDRFAETAAVGKTVRAGDLIGYVGTTGRSTGPHLHFEFRLDGRPVDPFSLGGGGGTLVASEAVEALTDQIIRVESAGNADAKNPLSTATGLGQFIESTWLRMMRDYRPDLTRTMSRADLLELRKDPTLSREMVQNLARENENFLRARGHQVDAGRLYLSHFLGPGGAHKVLSSRDDQTVLEVMGAGVVRANPFLANYTVADLQAWAQRKMRGVTDGLRQQPVPPEVMAYIEEIDALLAQES